MLGLCGCVWGMESVLTGLGGDGEWRGGLVGLAVCVAVSIRE